MDWLWQEIERGDSGMRSTALYRVLWWMYPIYKFGFSEEQRGNIYQNLHQGWIFWDVFWFGQSQIMDPKPQAEWWPNFKDMGDHYFVERAKCGFQLSYGPWLSLVVWRKNEEGRNPWLIVERGNGRLFLLRKLMAKWSIERLLALEN